VDDNEDEEEEDEDDDVSGEDWLGRIKHCVGKWQILVY
jgi:hypothetical protein